MYVYIFLCIYMYVCIYVYMFVSIYIYYLLKHAPLHWVIQHAELICLPFRKHPSVCHCTLFKTFMMPALL